MSTSDVPEGAPATAPSATPAPTATGRDGGSGAALPRQLVLVADDDPAMRSLLAWLLKEQGYEVEAVSGTAELMERLVHRTPDLLLLDIMMPEVDGLQALERIKADDRWRDLPVVMITALPPDEAAVRALGLGAADFVRKPFRVRELLARIQAQMRSREALARAREALLTTQLELRRARDEAESGRKLVEILHEVTGQLSPDEIYRILARRVARALNVSRCSVVLARAGDATGTVATAYENPGVAGLRIDLKRYPEIVMALEQRVAVLVEDARTNPLYDGVRHLWEREGRDPPVQSAIALPFTLDGDAAGVFFLRTRDDELPLTQDDVEFADTVIKAAVAAIRRAQVIESARADNARLEALATTDPLTQLLNRRALLDRLTSEVDRAKRYGTVVTLLMVDLDHFKSVNDTYGHLVGDAVLREVGALLQRDVRAVDLVARFGGEEFIIVLPETGTEGAVAFAERMRERLETHLFRVERGPQLHLTVSIGVATYPAPRVETTEDILARADEALYRAKADGRNLVRT